MVQGAEKLGRANSHSRTGQLPCQGCDLWSSSPLAMGASAREASKQKGLKSAPRPPHCALAVGLRGSPDRRVLLSYPTVHPREMASWSRPRGILTPAGSFGALARAQKGNGYTIWRRFRAFRNSSSRNGVLCRPKERCIKRWPDVTSVSRRGWRTGLSR